MSDQGAGANAGVSAAFSVTARAHPSLALVKYWGKQDGGVNLPATGSMGVSLAALSTTTTVTLADSDTDSVTVHGEEQPPERFAPFFDSLRETLQRAIAGPSTATERPEKEMRRATANGDAGAPASRATVAQIRDLRFHAVSENNFPTAAGLASSASGFAALTVATAALVERVFADAGAGRPAMTAPEQLSRIARVGSGSAARSVCAGFVRWDAGAEAAHSVQPADWWPDLRVIVLPLAQAQKPISSRAAMNRTRDTSPFYPAWVTDAPLLLERAVGAVEQRDVTELGAVMRSSYLRMFATMFAADPPILYWLPATVEALHRLNALRAAGVPAWETMDAGPQVKVLTTVESVDQVVARLSDLCVAEPVVSTIGGGAEVVPAGEHPREQTP
ncbi:MAG: diphosphomevalonate decarboxylase [Spirochaeta sp.]|nr:diphosphomevalonate decarboxylase [Spirochaeta sp.]